jgi:hypothetical protein
VPGLADLNSGEADTGRIIHGFEHVVGKAQHLGVHLFDELRLLTQHGIGQNDKRFDGHGFP